MSRKCKIGIVAIILSFVLFLQSVPSNVLSVLADGIVEIFTTEETVDNV